MIDKAVERETVSRAEGKHCPNNLPNNLPEILPVTELLPGATAETDPRGTLHTDGTATARAPDCTNPLNSPASKAEENGEIERLQTKGVRLGTLGGHGRNKLNTRQRTREPD